MLDDITIATRAEINEELANAESEFNDSKFILEQTLDRMKELSEYYNKLMVQKNRMEGGSDGRQ